MLPDNHEVARIEQFRSEANGDRTAFEKKILLRSQKCSPQKRERFAQVLEYMREKELATRVRMVGAMKDMSL